MIKYMILVIGCAFAFSAFGQDSMFSVDSLLQRNKVLSSDAFEGREIGTEGSAKAREFLIEVLKRYYVQPFLGKWEHDFQVIHHLKRTEIKGKNVVGVIEGSEFPDKYIVVSCHYDHLGVRKGEVYNGADDNASGTAGMLACAEYFTSNPPKHSIVLAAFDGEETGLIGSRAFVDDVLEKDLAIKANVNMDMIGRNVNNEIYLCGKSHWPELFALFSSMDEREVDVRYGHDGADGKDNWTTSSDHGNFHKKGIPFVYVGEEDHADYHETTDDFEGIQPAFYTEVVKIVISITRDIDSQISQ